MRTTIDGAGRLVVPKALRDAMRLGAGQELDISYVDGRLEVAVPGRDFTVDDRHPIPVLLPDGPVVPLSAETVREVLDETRR